MHIELDDNEDENTQIVPDGGSVRVGVMMRDSLDPVQRAVLFGDEQVLDAYQQFVVGREAWRAARDQELAAIAKGIATPSYITACQARDAAWQQRGEQQAAAWQQRPSANNAPPAAPSLTLGDAIVARDEAWRKRGEIQQNAWRR